MLRYSKILKIGISIIMVLSIFGSNNVSIAANTKNENLTTKSYVFDLDDLESSEIKELYNLKEDEIPSQYNLNDKIELFVEDQEATDLCDLFACIKSIETNYALTTGSSIDLSERYMDYISSKYFYGDREPGTINDGSTFAYASIYGVALEIDVPKEVSDASIIETAAPVCRVVSTVDFKELDETDVTNLKLLNIIKEHLMKYGSLAVGIGSPDLVSGVYNDENNAYYYKTGMMENEIRPNHQVSIVGWDDSYSRNNFNEIPDRDGAFICLNSWGKGWGQEGFFYVSYETLSEFEGLTGVIKTEDYIEETEYTYAEGLYTTGDIKEATRENKYYGVVFDTKTQGEYLKHIMLEMTSNPSKIKLYCNPYDENFDSEKYIYLGETANSFWGYTLMDWENPIELKGEKFALVFEINYDDDMNDDFINNDPSLTHSTHETIEGHFYNSSKIDSGFELLDYDLQLFVYTTAQNPMADTGTDIINDNDTKENHAEENRVEENRVEENNAEENNAEKIKENNGKAEGFSIGKNKRKHENRGEDRQENGTLNANETPSLVNFDEEYREGKITADAYVIHRLEDDNQDMTQMHIRNFIEDHFDELSEETLAYFYKKMSIEDMLGIDTDDAGKEASLRDFFTLRAQAAEDKPIEIVASSNKRFMVWYLTGGEHACTDELAQKVADTLEETVEKYDELFDTTYHFESKTISEGKFYDVVINIVKDHNFTEDDFRNSMQIYLVENKDAYATFYQDSSIFGKIRDKLKGYDDNYSVVLPYVTMDANKLSDNLEAALQVANHELFHHYQYNLFPKEYGRGISDEFVSESTANWASSLVSDKTNNKGYLNNWAAVARHTPNLLMDEETVAENGKTWLSYAFFPLLYNYSENVEDGIKRIKDAMYEDDFFGSLWHGIYLEDLNDLQESYMLGLLTQNYDNMNLVFDPEEKEDIVYRQIFDFENAEDSELNDIDIRINRAGAEFYKIIPDGKHKFTIEFIRKCETVVGYLVGEKDGEFFELDAFDYGYDLNYTFENEGTDYDTYYFIVGNSTVWDAERYAVLMTMEEIEPEEETEPEMDTGEEAVPEIDKEKEAETEIEYKDYEEKIRRGEKITRDDLPESGYFTFRSTWIIDDSVENMFTTYYYSGDKITREVYTEVFTDDTTEELIQGYIDGIIHAPEMYKENYIKNGKRLISEATEEQIEREAEAGLTTLDYLIGIINAEPWRRMAEGVEYEFGFVPEL